jgi:hypothetical protein
MEFSDDSNKSLIIKCVMSFMDDPKLGLLLTLTRSFRWSLFFFEIGRLMLKRSNKRSSLEALILSRRFANLMERDQIWGRGRSLEIKGSLRDGGKRKGTIRMRKRESGQTKENN